MHGIQKQSTGYPFCYTSSETQICTGKYDFADSGREDVEKKERNMKRKKREAFIMAAVAGSFAVSMTGRKIYGHWEIMEDAHIKCRLYRTVQRGKPQPEVMYR